jgi:hypothetical protein
MLVNSLDGSSHKREYHKDRQYRGNDHCFVAFHVPPALKVIHGNWFELDAGSVPDALVACEFNEPAKVNPSKLLVFPKTRSTVGFVPVPLKDGANNWLFAQVNDAVPVIWKFPAFAADTTLLRLP